MVNQQSLSEIRMCVEVGGPAGKLQSTSRKGPEHWLRMRQLRFQKRLRNPQKT